MRLTPIARTNLLAVAFVIALLTTACSDPLAYTIVNQTDETLITWGFHESCDQLVSYKGDYGPEQLVRPHQTLIYAPSSGGTDTQCIQVADPERRLIFAEPYQYDHTYTVETLDPIGPTVPERDVLPDQPWLGGVRERFVEQPVQMTILLVALLVTLPILAVYAYAILLLPKAVFLGLRSIYSGMRVLLLGHPST